MLLDHRLAVGRAHVLRRGDVGSARAALRCASACAAPELRPRHRLAGKMRFGGCDPLLHHLAPRRIASALSSSARQSSIAAANCPSCSLAMASRMRGSMSVRIELDARVRARARASSVTMPLLASTSAWPWPDEPLGRWAEQPDRLAIGFGRIGIAAPAHIDRSDHFPSLAFFGMLPEPRLDAGDQRFEILLAGGILRDARRAAGRAAGASRRRGRGRARAAGARRRRAIIAVLARGAARLGAIRRCAPCRRRQAAAARSRCARPRPPLADQAARAVALDLAELIAIDGGVERLGARSLAPAPASGRNRTKSTIAVRHGKDNPKEHGRALASARSTGRLGIGKGVRRGKVLSRARRLIPRNSPGGLGELKRKAGGSSRRSARCRQAGGRPCRVPSAAGRQYRWCGYRAGKIGCPAGRACPARSGRDAGLRVVPGRRRAAWPYSRA